MRTSRHHGGVVMQRGSQQPAGGVGQVGALLLGDGAQVGQLGVGKIADSGFGTLTLLGLTLDIIGDGAQCLGNAALAFGFGGGFGLGFLLSQDLSRIDRGIQGGGDMALMRFAGAVRADASSRQPRRDAVLLASRRAFQSG
ncbi:MAG: hypothetical protein MZV65_27275 [Chromatiales bacterium]|nr:hypothetical protein [Chromatiales bacterium]